MPKEVIEAVEAVVKRAKRSLYAEKKASGLCLNQVDGLCIKSHKCQICTLNCTLSAISGENRPL